MDEFETNSENQNKSRLATRKVKLTPEDLKL
jgi:hypothetical protein